MYALSLFDNNETKENFKSLLNDTIDIVRGLLNTSKIELYEIVLSELEDIKEIIVTLEIPLDEDEINQRYSFGGLAIKNLRPETELYKRLTTLYYGTLCYLQLD